MNWKRIGGYWLCAFAIKRDFSQNGKALTAFFLADD